MRPHEMSHQIGIAIGKLLDRLTRAEDELRRCELSIGRGHSPRKCVRLREEIERLRLRIERAERLQDSV